MPDYITWLAAAVCIINFACIAYVLRVVGKLTTERDDYRRMYTNSQRQLQVALEVEAARDKAE
jgi:hypothetical protein